MKFVEEQKYLNGCKKNDVRTFKEVAKAISRYTENPEDFMKRIHKSSKKEKKNDKKEEKETEKIEDIAKEEQPEVSEKKEIETPVEIPAKSESYGMSELEAIDKVTAKLLFDNGFKTLEDLKNASHKDLTRIKGINRKTAKNIIKELNDKHSKELSQIVNRQDGEVNTVK